MADTLRASKEDSHSADVTALVYADGRLYSGGDDGIIKVLGDNITSKFLNVNSFSWTEDLKLVHQVQAHPVNIYSLALVSNESGQTLYSSSNDGTIKAWKTDPVEFKTDLINYENEVEVLYVYKGTLYAGDDKGSVGVFKDDKLKLIFNMLEEVKDLIVNDNLMYTVRDLDLTITEFLSEENTRYMTKQTIEGKSPMCLAGDKLCFTSRCGKKIVCHHNNKEDKFKLLDSVEGHSMIINSMCSLVNPDGTVILCTGGWDKEVKIWNINEAGKITLSTSINVNTCINKLCFGRGGQLFVGGNEGLICRVDI